MPRASRIAPSRLVMPRGPRPRHLPISPRTQAQTASIWPSRRKRMRVRSGHTVITAHPPHVRRPRLSGLQERGRVVSMDHVHGSDRFKLQNRPHTKLDFVHLSPFELNLIGSETRVLLIPRGWPCSPCRSPSPMSWAFFPPSCPDWFGTT